MIYCIIRAFRRVDTEEHGGNTASCCSPSVVESVNSCSLYLFVTTSILIALVYCSKLAAADK